MKSSKILYFIGVCIELVAIILSIPTDVVYTRNWEYGKIKNVGSVHNYGSKTTYSIFSVLGVIYIICIIVVVIFLIIYLIMFFKDMGYNIPKFIIVIFYSFPLGCMIACEIALSSESKVTKNSIATYAEGVSTGYTSVGWFILFLMITAILVTFAALAVQKIYTDNNTEKKHKVVNTNDKPKKEIKEKDFKI